ncbi:hypothetical protein [Rhodococcus phenolicus]|uniref:hypothetical protein n=1 Tax=Rhodococcus phenolicus TaxID=263849 RepID=UPI000835B387|nr:hypothetical protein [Rhodococcus phenolicus]
MSSLTRPLTDKELAAAGIEPAPLAHETFTQVFAVRDGELDILDEDADDIPEPETADARPSGTWFALMLAGTFSIVIGAAVGIQAVVS